MPSEFDKALQEFKEQLAKELGLIWLIKWLTCQMERAASKHRKYVDALPRGTVSTHLFGMFKNEELGDIYTFTPWFKFWRPKFKVTRYYLWRGKV